MKKIFLIVKFNHVPIVPNYVIGPGFFYKVSVFCILVYSFTDSILKYSIYFLYAIKAQLKLQTMIVEVSFSVNFKLSIWFPSMFSYHKYRYDLFLTKLTIEVATLIFFKWCI